MPLEHDEATATQALVGVSLLLLACAGCGRDELPRGLVPPASVTVATTTAGHRVSWRRTHDAQSYEVLRIDGVYLGVPVSLPASASSYDDAREAWPVTQYQVTAVYLSEAGVLSKVAAEPVMVQPFSVSGAGHAFDAVAQRGPRGRVAVMDSAGRLDFVDDGSFTDPIPRPAVSRATATGEDRHDLAPDFVGFVPPSIVIDGQDHPHSVYIRQGGGMPCTLVHVWHDGSTWQEENVVVIDIPEHNWFGVAADGTVHVAWVDGAIGPLLQVQHAVKSSGAWSVVAVPAWRGPSQDTRFVVAPDGTAYLLVDARELLMRPPGGDWSEVALPVLSETLADLWDMWLLAADGCAVILYEFIRVPTPTNPYPDDTTYSRIYYVRQSTPGVWQEPELVARRWLTGGQTILDAALTAQCGRAQMVISLPDAIGSFTGDTELFVRGDSGWGGVVLGPRTNNFSLGFSPAGKAWVWAPLQWEQTESLAAYFLEH